MLTSFPSVEQPADLRVTAAAVSASYVALVTLARTPRHSGLSLTAHTLLELVADTPGAMRQLRDAVSEHLAEQSAQKLYLRKGAESGPYQGPPVRTKIEFAIYRLRTVPVQFLPSHLISSWNLPPMLGIDENLIALPSRPEVCRWALKTAAYAISKQEPSL